MQPFEVRVRIELSPDLQSMLSDAIGLFGRILAASAAAPVAAMPAPVEPAKPPPDAPAVIAALFDAAAHTSKPQAKPSASSALNKWSPQRLDILHRDYPAGVGLHEIVSTLNALPGGDVTAVQVGVMAAYHKIRRPAGARSKPASPSAPRQEPTRPPATSNAPAPIVTFAAPVEGAVEATFVQIRDWCLPRGLAFDGRNMDAVNKLRARLCHPPMVCVG